MAAAFPVNGDKPFNLEELSSDFGTRGVGAEGARAWRGSPTTTGTGTFFIAAMSRAISPLESSFGMKDVIADEITLVKKKHKKVY